MTLAYLIVQHGGHYANEDVYHKTLAASLDPARAQAYRDKLRENYARETEIHNAAWELLEKAHEFGDEYAKQNPRPESPPTKNYPRCAQRGPMARVGRPK